MDLEHKALQLGAAFAAELRKDLAPWEVAEVIRRNEVVPGYGGDGACASHDFCDANMTMLGAWKAAFGGEPAFLEGTDEKGDHSPEGEASLTLINAAWKVGQRAFATPASAALDYLVRIDDAAEPVTLRAVLAENELSAKECAAIISERWSGDRYDGGGGAAFAYTIWPVWTLGEHVEITSQWDGGPVVHVDGDYVILRLERGGQFFAVHGDPESYSNGHPLNDDDYASTYADLESAKAAVAEWKAQGEAAAKGEAVDWFAIAGDIIGR